MVRIGTLVVVVWLLIGTLAAWQRDYLDGGNPQCVKVSRIVLTVLAGPLNYMGVNPKVECVLPEPSK